MPNGPARAQVEVVTLPLPAGASTEETLLAIKAKTDNLDVALSTRTKPADTQTVSVANFPATQPVSGTFFQATQPVSLAVNTPDVADRVGRLLGHVTVDNASIQVTGSFWQATQPISGTFWQATQPVSIASMPSTPVTGAFYQATQPISVAALPLPSGASTEATLALIKAKTDNLDVALSTRTKPSDTQPVSGAFWQATQPVSIAAQVKAREDTAAMTWVSLKTAAPTASAVQADTGALAAGDYDFTILLSAADTLLVGKGMVIEHRNAANAATLQTLGGVVAGGSENVELRRYTMALNERIRVIAGTAAGAASSMYVSAIGRRVA